MRVLYLEDDCFQRELAKGWLEAAGHLVQCVGDGSQAIKSIERDSFDIAVLDWEVPSPSGFDVLRWIRRRGLGIPVMFLTSHAGEEELVRALGSGADDFLAKPVRRLEFLARVAALGRRSEDPAVRDQMPARRRNDRRRASTSPKCLAHLRSFILRFKPARRGLGNGELLPDPGYALIGGAAWVRGHLHAGRSRRLQSL